MMNNEHRSILKNERDIFSRVKLEYLSPFLREYKIFNQYMWNDIKTTEDMLDALPYRGPRAFQNIIEILRKAEYFKEADLLEVISSDNKTGDNNNLYYVMSTSPLGMCLIINNVEFDEPRSETAAKPQRKLLDREKSSMLLERHGSDADATALHDFFVSINFNVTVERNKKASEMKACLKEFSRRDFTNVDSMIVIILSHGNQRNNKEFIYGTDFDCVYKSEMCDYFNNKNCEQLQNKPKILFFVCSRGGLDYEVSKCLPNESSIVCSRGGLDYEVPKCLPNESNDNSEIIMPSLSDMFVVHSNSDNDKRTCFCEELVKVLRQYYHQYDLETIIKLVNKNLQNKVSILHHNIPIAHVEALGGTKKIMFCNTLS